MATTATSNLSFARQRTGMVRAGLGGVLMLAAWAVSWSDWESIRFHTFFPLWLGYILLVDGVTAARIGTSIYERGRPAFITLFLVSAPAWWLFEVLNIRLANWVYILPRDYSWLAYHAQASLAFSTVIPAVFCTAELIRATLVRGPIQWLSLAPTRAGLVRIAMTGAVALLLTQLFPVIFFPLVWLSLFFIFDPVARLIGQPSLAGQVAEGRWDTVIVIWVATLWCGFLWEMWNSRAMPKWTYELPAAEWLRIFEMPILGFGGYLPFGLELYALYRVVTAILPARLVADLRFDRVETRGDRETAPRS